MRFDNRKRAAAAKYFTRLISPSCTRHSAPYLKILLLRNGGEGGQDATWDV